MASSSNNDLPEATSVKPAVLDYNLLASALLNDSNIENLAGEIAKDPTFNKMVEQLQKTYQGDPKDVYATMNRVFENPKFVHRAESLMQAPLSDMLKMMIDPSHKAQLRVRKEIMREDLSLKPILEEIRTKGPGAMIRYWDDKEKEQVFHKLAEALGVVVSETATISRPDDTKESRSLRYADVSSIHYSAYYGFVEGLFYAIKGGVDKNAKDAAGRTALHVACEFGEVQCARFLVKAGTDVNSLDYKKNTALHYAADCGSKECVVILLKSGADVTFQNSEGKTPMDVANDAAVTLRNLRRKTSIEVAKLKIQEEVLELLNVELIDKEQAPRQVWRIIQPYLGEKERERQRL